ncbi:TPA: hypothetical protein NJ373_000641 [Vibrio parahaemolyticus]|nr:hypothetical protein [Vibrio parahaemolyticus]HCH6423628.1 hypothetical protein [Vibrio parahaemolyticus]
MAILSRAEFKEFFSSSTGTGTSTSTSSSSNSPQLRGRQTDTTPAVDEKESLIDSFNDYTTQLTEQFEQDINEAKKDIAVLRRDLVDRDKDITELKGQLVDHKQYLEDNKYNHIKWLVGVAGVSLVTVVGGYLYLDTKFDDKIQTVSEKLSGSENETSGKFSEILAHVDNLKEKVSDIDSNADLIAKTREEHAKTQGSLERIKADNATILSKIVSEK